MKTSPATSYNKSNEMH